jgi:hypothetical protein
MLWSPGPLLTRSTPGKALRHHRAAACVTDFKKLTKPEDAYDHGIVSSWRKVCDKSIRVLSLWLKRCVLKLATQICFWFAFP